MRAELTERAWRTLARHQPMPPLADCRFAVTEPDGLLVVSAAGRELGRCRVVPTVRGERVRRIKTAATAPLPGKEVSA